MGSLHEIRQPSRPSLTRSRSTCLVAASSSSCNHHSNNTGTGSHHKRRRRADTIFLRRRPFISASSSNVDATPPSASVLDSLDLSLPLSRHLERVRGILECSIEEAMDKLQSLQLELSSTDTDDNDDDTAGESDVDSHSSDTDPTEPVHAFMDLSPIPSTSTSTFYSSSTSKKEDYETLQAFLNDVYTLLSSIRKDLHEQLPSLPPLPQLPTMPAIIPTRFDKAAVYEHLASNYEKAQEVFFHLSLYSPLSISLPEFPASLAASISSAAKGALAAASASSTPTSSGSRTPQTAPPRSSDEANDSNTDQIHSSASSTSPSNPSTFSLPQPPLSAIRSFLISESKRLSSKLPSRPSLQDWHPSRTAIQSAINDASTFVHDEKEKLKEMLHDETEKLKQALLYGKERLLEFHELPMDWRNNKYILSGYRFIPADRPGELFLSAFKWHNETMNIYTHFIPAAYIIYYILFIFPDTQLGDPTLNTFYDRSANLAFLLASLICLLLSAAWHLAAGCGTYSVFQSCATLDYLGISALISTSIISLTHAAFRCDPATDLAYNVMTCVFGGLGMYLPWKSWFNDREHKNIRITFFVLLACVGAAPIVHMCCLYGAKATWHFYSPVLYSLIAYKIGLLFYALDFPEALRPGGLFDTLAHSHQFWHCAIIVAIALHWQALKGMNEAGLEGYSCAGRDPYEVQYFAKWLHRRDEL